MITKQTWFRCVPMLPVSINIVWWTYEIDDYLWISITHEEEQNKGKWNIAWGPWPWSRRSVYWPVSECTYVWMRSEKRTNTMKGVDLELEAKNRRGKFVSFGKGHRQTFYTGQLGPTSS